MRNRIPRRAWIKGLMAAAVVAMFAVTGPAVADEKKVVNWGILAVESQEDLMNRWGPLLKAIEQKTGLEIKPFFASDYTGVIEAMRFDKVDVVLYGNKSVMTAQDIADAEVFAQIVELDGTGGYWSILVTQADNDKINSLEDVLTCDKTLNFGIGDPQSTSGFLVPTTFVFAANNIQPRDCFKTVRNGSHQANLLSVANGHVDVATANNRALYHRLKSTDPDAAAKVKEIWRSPLIAADPMAWRKDLDPELKAKIYWALISFGNSGTPEQIQKEREILKVLKYGGFKPSSDLQSLPFREMQANKEILQIQADETMTEDEKKTKIAELKKQIEDVRKTASAVPILY